MPESDNTPPEKDSKSQRKRDMTALQKIGETLVGLPASSLAKIPLSGRLLDSILIARTLKTHEARRRQLQFIGKLMRDIDPLPIQIAIDKVQSKNQQGAAQFHQIERWRDRLIAEGDVALQNLLEAYPVAETHRQQLRQLVRNAQQDKANEKNTGAEKELFRYLRELLPL